MLIVFPGVADTLAKLLLLASMFISDDLPTLERPIKANSGFVGAGASVMLPELLTNLACIVSFMVIEVEIPMSNSYI